MTGYEKTETFGLRFFHAPQPCAAVKNMLICKCDFQTLSEE